MFFTDWGFWGFVVGALGLFVALGIAFWQRRKKALVYEILTNTVLISKAKELEGKVKITYEGDYINSVHLIVLKLINSGNQPITKADFDEPLTVSFEAKVKILSVDFGKINPNGLDPLLHVDSDMVVLEPLLLNPTDSIIINILTNNSSPPIISGRIVGVKEIQLRKNEQIENFHPWWSNVIPIAVGLIIFTMLEPEIHTSKAVHFVSILAVASFSFVIYFFIRGYRIRRRLRR